jgi:hypothetical protein
MPDTMKAKFYLIIALFFAASTLQAQTLLKGTVTEAGSNNRLANAFVRDDNNKQITLTDNNGNFQIRTETGHLLIISSPGYGTDTLYVTDMSPKKVQLEFQTIALREVAIRSNKDKFDPHKDYADIYNKAKIYPLSPSSWFGKEAKDARRLKKYFVREAQERHIDSVFNTYYVGSIVPLKGSQLDDFMLLYRPTYAFLRSNTGESLAVYINDCYKKYMALPPDKRVVQKLTAQ